METKNVTTDHAWDKLPLLSAEDFLYPVEILVFAETCSSSREAVKAVHGGKVPPMKPKYLEELVNDDRLEMVEWVRAQKPPCPCDFEKNLQLAKDGGIHDYFQKYDTATTRVVSGNYSILTVPGPSTLRTFPVHPCL